MRPYKEVILQDDIRVSNGRLFIDDSVAPVDLKNSSVQVIWRGTIDGFRREFGIPDDAPLSTKETGLSNGDVAAFVKDWNYTTLNFKFNYHVWYKDGNSNGYYVLGSNNTVNITIPNVLVYNGNQSNNNTIKYDSSNGSLNRIYNPNLFPLPISITSFSSSNKTDDFQNVATNSGTDSLVYLAFRYGVNDSDISICLLTKNSNNFQINNKTLVIPYMSLTFTGFNKIYRPIGLVRDEQ